MDGDYLRDVAVFGYSNPLTGQIVAARFNLGVVILTTTHELGPKEHRAGTVIRNPVVIGNDVSIGEESIILLDEGGHRKTEPFEPR